MNKTILGLDLGTNSIGWALIEQDSEVRSGKILGIGSRIIPMSQDQLSDFQKGNTISQTSERTKFRSTRRLRERHLLRRERLHRVLHVLNFLPEHYSASIDFEKHLGQFKDESEPKLAYANKEFLFKQSFEEMLSDFKVHQPALLLNKEGKPALIPYDWTIYYLRKKALTKPISKEELAWLLLNFNQKRGYYQLRGEEEEESNKTSEFHALKVVDVQVDESPKGKGEKWYSLTLENGMVYRRSSLTPLFDWTGKTREFIVTTEFNEDGTVKTDKEGNVKRSFRAPGEDDWTLIKKKTEYDIELSQKTVGAFIYDTLLLSPMHKIRGKLVRTIERKYYKAELRQILIAQCQFHHELRDQNLLIDCIRELYRNNESHQQQLATRDLIHLFIEDIIFYQRPLRSQKSTVSNCTLEFRKYRDQEGAERVQSLKAIPKSNPYFQEFRLWQWIHNLSIYRIDNDENVTEQFLLDNESFASLFEYLNNKKEIDQKQLLKFLLEMKGIKGKGVNSELQKYRWNYVQDKKYPCNETRSMINSRFDQLAGIPSDFLTKAVEQWLWHIIYSVTDKLDYEKSLKTFALKNKIDPEAFVAAFRRFPPFESEYGNFSEKAIKKLLPLMRTGKYWNWDSIEPSSRQRIENILNGEYDERIKNRVREKTIHLTERDQFQRLPLWLAQYIVYDRHSEASNLDTWNSPSDVEQFLADFRQHSLRNPIVEQVVTETLRVVKDLWTSYGSGAKNFFDEIHIELGREMKKTKDERAHETKQITTNENSNLRIKALLAEMKNDPNVANVRPYSPSQQEILSIYEEGVLGSNLEIDDDILKISRTAQPSSTELKRYKLWLEQKYRSPYTGETIPLNKLFTPEYEIEHIIPQSLYFDNSYNNKVICESAVNRLKDNQIGLAFIKSHHGEIVQLGLGKTVRVFEVDAYQDYIKEHFAKNRSKRNRLLMEEIPDQMIERQLNDTRYITRYISGLLSHLVRSNQNDDGPNSKNLIQVNGKITTELRKDWGLNDVWNDLILPRFERMNKITGTTHFTAWSENHQKFIPTIPLEFSAGFSKKRIDHRHHALDALVIACSTRDHVNLLNNQSAKSETKRYDLQYKLRRREFYFNEKENRQKDAFKEFYKPWGTFTQESRLALESTIVSFKQNLRVINKATNRYTKWAIKDGKKVKESVVQKGVNWAIRKSLHKDTVSGKVNLSWIKVPKGKILSATRKKLDTTFDLKTIGSITDTGIQKILKNYLAARNNNPELAFSSEGIEDMNRNIQQYNDGKLHKPINKVRVFEVGSKFPLGEIGNKKHKYVEAAKGTNLFFGVYRDDKGMRVFDTIPLNEIVEREKQSLDPVPLYLDKLSLIFRLSPHDLVCIPVSPESTPESETHQNLNSKIDPSKIYKVVSFTGHRISFIPHYIARSIVDKVEFTTLNKIERDLDGTMIKEVCQLIRINRLGKVSNLE